MLASIMSKNKAQPKLTNGSWFIHRAKYDEWAWNNKENLYELKLDINGRFNRCWWGEYEFI